MNSSKMKAVILAAGIASRLRPLTDHTPKCLLMVGGKSILELTLDNIIANNIKEVIIVTGYLEEQIKQFVSSNYPELNAKYIYNEVYSSTNNIYSLWLTREELAGNEMLLMDSDIIFDSQIIGRLLSSGYENCLAMKKHNVQQEEIKVKLDKQGRIVEIGKEVKLQDAIGESIGIEKFSVASLEKLFDIIHRKITVNKQVNQFYEAAFQELVDTAADMYVVDTTDLMCMEIDTADDFKAAADLINSRIR
jgi:choline kinase